MLGSLWLYSNRLLGVCAMSRRPIITFGRNTTMKQNRLVP
jgi:hypothetical protein